MEHRIPYTSWNKEEKTWNPQTEGVFLVVNVSGRPIKNADGSIVIDYCLIRTNTLFDCQQAYKALLAVRPDLKGVIEPVKAPCVFDAPKTCINVERWY